MNKFEAELLSESAQNIIDKANADIKALTDSIGLEHTNSNPVRLFMHIMLPADDMPENSFTVGNQKKWHNTSKSVIIISNEY